MARARTAEPTRKASTALVPVAPKLRPCCGTCANWLVFEARPSLGRCMASMSVGASHIVTLDLAICSDHIFKEVQ